MLDKIKLIKIGGLIMLLYSPASAQDILSKPDGIAEKLLMQAREQESLRQKGFLEKLIKCDGQNGNANMSPFYSDAADFYFDQDGKCKQYSPFGG